MKTKQLSLCALMLSFIAFPQGDPHQSSQPKLSNDNLNSQQISYKRISVSNPSESVIHELEDLGIDLSCGAVLKNNQLSLELFDYELELLTNQGINYTVLIDDLTKFYSERAVEDLPKAKAELAAEKALSATKSYSVNEIINNVGQYDACDEIDWAVPFNWGLNPNASPNSFGGCLTYSQVLQELDDMRALYPNLISVKTDVSPTGQTTIEGRTVYYVRISDNPDIDEAGEPETLYQSLIHSREAATVMNQLYFMWYLLENYSTDDAIKNLVNNQALYFIPVYNPDGFVYNETVAPDGGGGQRKNRNVSAGSCSTYLYGIDLNRNSAYYWGNGGSSTDPCSSTYMGSSQFSEPETQIMRDFFLLHDFELALNHHSYKNAMLHAYAGTTITNPRPDEYSKYNHDMTYYNRYAHGPSTSISSLNSGNMNDWMLGGPAGVSANGTPTGTGSGKHTLAWTPENGLSSEGTGGTYGGFWPAPSNYLPIAKRAMRMNFLAAYFSGKYAKLHDLNQNDITSLSGNLNFAIENLGQTASDFTLTVTPVSSNVLTTGGPSTQTGMSVLQQNNINISYTLDPSIQADDEIEFKVVLTNDYASDNVLYEANIVKTYSPSNVISDDPDTDNLSNWTSSGGSWSTTSDAYSGTTAITSTSTGSYSNNESKSLQFNGSIDLSGKSLTLIQFYAKWDLERSFDYVQIEGSTDGSSWTPLCGKLTKPGAPNANNTYSGKTTSDNNFQPDGEALYDGDTQDKWNMEEIVVDATNNSFLYDQNTVYLRFDFKTDSSNREDSYYNVDFEGFYFDDFQVITVDGPCVATVPIDLTASNITTSSATLSWDAVSGTTYEYRYREVGAPSWTTISTSNISEIINGLAVGAQYEAQVRSICPDNSSTFSNSTIFSTSSDITLYESYFETGWDNWIDGGSDAARYSGQHSYEGNYSIRLRDNSGTASSMTLSSLDFTGYSQIDIEFHYTAFSMENGEDFLLLYDDGNGFTTVDSWVRGIDFNNSTFYTVNISLNAAQYNLVSNGQLRFQCDASANNDQIYIDQVIIRGIPDGPDVTPPTAPTSLTAFNTTETTTDLSWTASIDNIGVTSYDVYQDGVMIGNSTGTTYNVIGLIGSTSYSFYVIAKDAAGNESPASNTENVTTQDPPDTQSPSAPTNLTENNTTHNSTDLSWTASTDNVGVTGYDVYQDGGVIATTAGTSYPVTGLSPSTLYGFHVIAKDAAGNESSSSNVINVTTEDFIDTEAPTAPTNLSSSNTTETTTDLTWNASTDNVAVTDYDVYQDGVMIANVTGTSYGVSGLLESTTYAFHVIANDAAGNSSTSSNSVNVTTLTAPTCFDGIQNGDETGVDCGGSICAPCSGSNDILNQGYFESGWDGWTDGGNDCARYSGANSYEGSYSIRLRDNSGSSSSMTLSNVDLSSYDEVEVDFYFYVNSMENNEDFWLRFYDGSSWNTVTTWTSGSDISNGLFYNATVTFNTNDFTFASNSGFRFQCDASGNNDQIYIDQVTVTGISGGGAAASSSTSIMGGAKVNYTEFAFEDDFLVYPNPVKGSTLNVKINEEIDLSYRVINMLGQTVMSGELNNYQINVEHLRSGVYFIEINDGDEVMMKRFIRE
jgi:chitodextrinase